RRRHTRCLSDWSSDVCSSDLEDNLEAETHAAHSDAFSSASEFRRLAVAFREMTPSLGYADLSKYWWYHTVDLGNGLITPGCYDRSEERRVGKEYRSWL